MSKQEKKEDLINRFEVGPFIVEEFEEVYLAYRLDGAEKIGKIFIMKELEASMFSSGAAIRPALLLAAIEEVKRLSAIIPDIKSAR